MIRCLIVFLLLLVCSQADAQFPAKNPSDTTSIHADSSTIAALKESSASHIIWHDVKEGAYDGLQYVQRPLHWNLREWAIMATGIGFTAMLEVVDDPLARSFFQHNQGKFGDQIEKFGNNFYGKGIATGLTAITLYSVGLETDNNKLRVMGRHVLQSFAYAGLTTTALKIIVGRNRPFLNQGSFVYHGFSLSNVWNSMPSGHVTVAAALSESLAADIGNTYASIGLYTCLAATVFGRLYSDEHWLSDTFLGGVIGTAAGYWVSQEEDHYDMKTNSPKHAGLMIVPTGNGFALIWPL
ncbi:MAG: phosphatase PAP2 family protein [Bacteroidota bacterium]|nr:phosphatase PAP2 family protein [Bacteroidota bacterium]